MTSNHDAIIERQGIVLSVTLNRPEQANALSPEAVESIISAFSPSDLAGTKDVRCGVIRGNGKHFCAGFDLSDLESLSDGDLLWRFLRIETMLQAVHHAPYPVLALAHGQVIGAGADLFAACSTRIAAPKCRFQMPGWHFELALGTRRLTRLIGADQARHMLIDTTTVDAEQALVIGLANEIATPEQWDTITDEHTRRASVLSSFAVSSMLSLTATDTRAQDIATIVASAGRPGLKHRILAFREKIAHERAARQKK